MNLSDYTKIDYDHLMKDIKDTRLYGTELNAVRYTILQQYFKMNLVDDDFFYFIQKLYGVDESLMKAIEDEMYDLKEIIKKGNIGHGSASKLVVLFIEMAEYINNGDFNW